MSVTSGVGAGKLEMFFERFDHLLEPVFVRENVIAGKKENEFVFSFLKGKSLS